jgi:predicted transcriptional regulator
MEEKFEKHDWWNDLSRDQYLMIIEAERELENGQGIPHEKVLEHLNKWLTKKT